MQGRWILMVLSLAALVWLMGGCGGKQWSPTDPRTAQPDTSQTTVDDHWQIGVGADVKP